ncbi:C-type lectin domain family 4 member E-like [Spea bombifrons]|uniref:C-type lectin domain family 4 member E-like n=1 Tax=Spea bombifrons TaxID=233779 RepID=UPI0023498D81|nr:C-type lectin domain family 4 member E-like [Spea bombifrons]
MQEQKYRELQENYTGLLKEFEKLVENHLLVPRESVLLQNCQPRESGAASKTCLYCPPGWQLYEKSCYLLSPHALSWQESLQWCQRQGGHLAVIKSEDKQYFMQGFVKRTSWIGLSDRDIEGDWRWVDGTPYDTTLRFWMLNQPNNMGNEDCVTVTPGSGWNDEKCFRFYSSVCERIAHQLRWNGDVLSN